MKIGSLEAHRIRVWSFDEYFDHVYIGYRERMFHLSYPAILIDVKKDLDAYLKRFPAIAKSFVVLDAQLCRRARP